MGNNINTALNATDDLQNAYKIDNSVHEVSSLQRGFLRSLLGNHDAERQSFEQLHSNIMENYEGEERDKRILALESAFNLLDPERQGVEIMQLEVKNHLIRDINDASYLNHIELSFAVDLLKGFIVSGIEEGFSLFEEMKQELLENHEGKELSVRLEALKNGFILAATSYAKLAIAKAMTMAENPTLDAESANLAREQLSNIEKLNLEKDELINHIINKFLAAWDFLDINGSLVGFFDIEGSDILLNLPSLRDIEFH